MFNPFFFAVIRRNLPAPVGLGQSPGFGESCAMQRPVRLALKVVPNASREGIAGWLGDALKVRVSQPPEGGRANTAVCRLLARHLGVDEQCVAVVGGTTSPRKTVEIRGLTEDELRGKLPR